MHHLISGAAGFIGSHLCDRLLADGGSVVVARELARELLGAEPPEPEAHAQLAAGPLVAADLVARTPR